MSTFKKAKVVMLPTNEKVINTKEYQLLLSASLFWTSKIEIERYTEGWFFLNNSSNPNSCAITVPNVENFKHQHLYIISDDEIKKGDYIYCTITNAIEIAKYNHDCLIRDWKKVIATTDTSLYIHQKETISLPERVFYLPQPSQQFIQKFVEEYNKGNIITDVLVEYELISNEEYFGNTINPDDDVPYFDENLKINPKDNTITIKKVKDSYTREEVDRLLDEQASKTTAEMLEKFKDRRSKEDEDLRIAFENFACAVYDENYNKDTSFRKRAELMSKKWIKENLI